MKILIILLATCIFAACSSSNSKINELKKQLAEKDTLITTLKEQLNTTTAIARMGLMGSPLENFFAADEFWENIIYDPNACANQCYLGYKNSRAGCYNMPPGRQRDSCIAAISISQVDCVKGCGLPR